MRILVDLGSHITGDPQITQVERVPPIGVEGQTAINGKYLIPVTPGANVKVDTSSYVLDGGGEIDGGDVASQSYAWLLAMFPQFENIYFNPLLTEDHVLELDFTQGWNTFPTRAQTGRETGAPSGFVEGQAPNMTAILPVNDSMTPSRPGVLVTDLIDIGPFTLDAGGDPVGTDEFLIYWKLYDFTTTHDVYAEDGALVGSNTPAIKYALEVDQEPADFEVYFSPDDGVHWIQVGLLEPVAFCEKTTSFRLAFVNHSSTKVYLATFGVLF